MSSNVFFSRIQYILLLKIFIVFGCNSKTENSAIDNEKRDSLSVIENKLPLPSFDYFKRKIKNNIGIKDFNSSVSSERKVKISEKYWSHIMLPDMITSKLDSKSKKLYSTIHFNSVYAYYIKTLVDSTVTVTFVHDVDNESEKYALKEFIITYSTEGEILSFFPTKYTIHKDRVFEKTFSSYFDKHQFYRYTVCIDSSRTTTSNYFKYYRNEFIEEVAIDKNGTIETIKPKTNVLETFVNTYAKVIIENRRFKAYKTCGGDFNTIEFKYDSVYNRYLIEYKAPDRQTILEIVSVWMSYEENLKNYHFSQFDNFFTWNYSGNYSQLFLKDIETGEYDDRFLAIGSSGTSSVFEFHFSRKYGHMKFYYTQMQLVNDGVISIAQTDCK